MATTPTPPTPPQPAAAAGAVAYPVLFDVEYPDRKLNRVTTFFRLLLAIPVLILLGLLQQTMSSTSTDYSATLLAAGGIIFVPVLVFVFSFDQLGAQATSLAAIIPVAIIGAWLQSNDNLVNWRAALLMGIGAAIGVLLGAEVATRLDNANLAQAFGAVLVLAGGEMIVSSARRIRGAQA